MHPSVEFRGFENLERCTNSGPVWIGAFSTLVIADDGLNPDARGRLQFGSDIYIGENCNIRACGALISIGNDVMIANGVSMAATNHGMNNEVPMNKQAWSFSPTGVEIGNDVWIGAHAVLLPGTRIGTGSIIAAGAVVRGEIPPMCVYGGIPARQLKQR